MFLPSGWYHATINMSIYNSGFAYVSPKQELPNFCPDLLSPQRNSKMFSIDQLLSQCSNRVLNMHKDNDEASSDTNADVSVVIESVGA